jgi:hypothetical protein
LACNDDDDDDDGGGGGSLLFSRESLWMNEMHIILGV